MGKIYFSIDIETNGLAAGLNSMISLGAVAVDVDESRIVDSWKMNLEPLSDLTVCEDTMAFWAKFPEAYCRATEGAVDAKVAMKAFAAWVDGICTEYGVVRPVAAAWKPGFDLAFLRYYLHRFIGRDVFGRAGSGLDIKTLTALALKQPFSETQIATVPSSMKGSFSSHTHDALEDATEQAYVMCNAREMLGSTL